MTAYKLANNIVGWLVFAIAATVYLLTIEPTASFWDCGEFILSAHKLEVGHPPGAPFFMLLGNLFTQLAPHPSYVALMMNALSAVCSALTILFLFWSITYLAKKLILRDAKQEITISQLIMIIGSGVVGALVYTFSDTFWFSAVEAEVYAMSSLLTALVFWVMLKWEESADDYSSDRWIVLIAYLIGLSIGVHLLNLLCIPALGLIFYFKRYKRFTMKGFLITLLVSGGILLAILYGLIQGVAEVGGWFELLFVNLLGLPYNSGLIAYVLILLSVIVWCIVETGKETPQAWRVKASFILSIALLGIPFMGNNIGLGIFIVLALIVFFYLYKRMNCRVLNTTIVCLLLIVIGYSSYALILIRSTANTPMDQNSPEDIFALQSYLSREQYGQTPLLYGHSYASLNASRIYKDGGPVYARKIKTSDSDNDAYVVVDRKKKGVYPDKYNMLFPRMYSQESRHIEAYAKWSNSKVSKTTPNGEVIYIQPSFLSNLKFFFNYQINFMYWRYFMWNFSGRQNDIQGHGEITKGNWITGVGFLDAIRLGPQDDMPDFIEGNKGRNKYYMLPLLLGLLGIVFQLYSERKGREGFWIVFTLFFMTGLAIVVYLNQTPFQVRERDYAYAGSFYAFSIWVGLGVLAVVETLKKIPKVSPMGAAVVGSGLALIVPIQMVSQNWDDHDRSGRYLARDVGYNYLIGCEDDAVIFTNGDNDTFPLWYNQEIEGVRPDIRICNLTYLNGDWYIDQMKRESYDSKPLPINWEKKDYLARKHEIAVIYPMPEFPFMRIEDAWNWVKSEDKRIKYPYEGDLLDIIPTNKLVLEVDSVAVMRSGLVSDEYAHLLSSPILFDFSDQFTTKQEKKAKSKGGITKGEMMTMEMLNNNSDWSRPFYFAITVGNEQFLRLDNYLRTDGLACRLMPYPAQFVKPIDLDILYDNLMNKYRWGNLQQPGLYMDEQSLRICFWLRSLFVQLAEQLIEEEIYDKAKEVLDRCIEVMPQYNVPYENIMGRSLAQLYWVLGEEEKAYEIYKGLMDQTMKTLNWYNRLNDDMYRSMLAEIYYNSSTVEQALLPFFQKYDPVLFEKYYAEYILLLERMYRVN